MIEWPDSGDIAKGIAHYRTAMAGPLDEWVPASGGIEPVFTCEGRRFQWCYNPKQQKHAYYDVDRDLILVDGLERELPAALRY